MTNLSFLSQRPTDSSNSGPLVLSRLRDCKLHQHIHPTALCLTTICVSALSAQRSDRLCHCLRLAAINARAPPTHSSHCLCHCLCLAAIGAIRLTAHSSHRLCHCLRLATIDAHLRILLTAFVLRPSVRELRRCILLTASSCGHQCESFVGTSFHLSFLWARSSTLLCCLILSREFYPLPATCDIWCCHIYSTGALRSHQTPCDYHRSLIDSARASSLDHEWSSHGGGISNVALILHCVNVQNESLCYDLLALASNGFDHWWLHLQTTFLSRHQVQSKSSCTALHLNIQRIALTAFVPQPQVCSFVPTSVVSTSQLLALPQ